jgi:hypothetical protein
MEIFVSLYMRPWFSPCVGLKPEVEKAKIRPFFRLRPILGFLISAFNAKNTVASAEIIVRKRTTN